MISVSCIVLGERDALVSNQLGGSILVLTLPFGKPEDVCGVRGLNRYLKLGGLCRKLEIALMEDIELLLIPPTEASCNEKNEERGGKEIFTKELVERFENLFAEFYVRNFSGMCTGLILVFPDGWVLE